MSNAQNELVKNCGCTLHKSMKHKQVDPSVAPVGYTATQAKNGLCTGCAFEGQEKRCKKAKCVAIERADKCSVIYLKQETK